MTIHAFHFVLGILVPYFAEQYAYSRFISNIEKPEATEPGTVAQGYGWRLIWDASYFLLVITQKPGILLICSFARIKWNNPLLTHQINVNFKPVHHACD